MTEFWIGLVSGGLLIALLIGIAIVLYLQYLDRKIERLQDEETKGEVLRAGVYEVPKDEYAVRTYIVPRFQKRHKRAV